LSIQVKNSAATWKGVGNSESFSSELA